MLSFKLLLVGTLLLGGNPQSFAEEQSKSPAKATVRKKIVRPAAPRKRIKAKSASAQGSKKGGRVKRIESSVMFPPDNH